MATSSAGRHLAPGLALLICVGAMTTGVLAQQNRIDVVTPAAPELASYGRYDIGVRTVRVSDKNRPDILNTKDGGAMAKYGRALTLEVWYPARLAPGQKAGGDYRAITRDPSITATLHGTAVRDAAPLTTEGAFPLVIVSHGYPGNLSDEPPGRKPFEQGIHRHGHRSHRQYLR